MTVITKPVSEEQILRPVEKMADIKEIKAYFEAQAECCVVHLCGCKNE